MLPTASHTIHNLTNNLPVSREEAGVWTNAMMNVVQTKIKMTKAAVTVLTLRKLLDKGIGTNSVEQFTRNEVGFRRIPVIRKIMRVKVLDAIEKEMKVKEDFNRKIKYIERRWGHNVGVMCTLKAVMQSEVRRTWEERRGNMVKKVDFLQKKWGRVRQDLVNDDGKEWRGIKYANEYLEEKRKVEGRDKPDVPLAYGDVVLSQSQQAVLNLPAKFCTYEPVTEHKMKVAAGVMGAKTMWELHKRLF